jgi:16S rRNA (guanine527-N7)-methyltransferase
MHATDPDRAPTWTTSAPDAVEPGEAPVTDPEATASDAPGSGVPQPPPAAAALFGPNLPLADRYARMLVSDGVVRGLIGPREAPRIWDRHLLNCVALAELIPYDAYVVDVGSGAGLPGIVLSVVRPDIYVVLVDSLSRRTDFLTEAVAGLGLERRVEVVRGRAEDLAGRLRPADVVTARAVAPLGRLAAWCLPLLRGGGVLLAVKGSSAADEVAEHRAAVRQAGGGEPEIRQCGVGIVEPAVTVVSVPRARSEGTGKRPPRSRRPAGGQ